jgi:hypothetical protein
MRLSSLRMVWFRALAASGRSSVTVATDPASVSDVASSSAVQLGSGIVLIDLRAVGTVTVDAPPGLSAEASRRDQVA